MQETVQLSVSGNNWQYTVERGNVNTIDVINVENVYKRVFFVKNKPQNVYINVRNNLYN